VVVVDQVPRRLPARPAEVHQRTLAALRGGEGAIQHRHGGEPHGRRRPSGPIVRYATATVANRTTNRPPPGDCSISHPPRRPTVPPRPVRRVPRAPCPRSLHPRRPRRPLPPLACGAPAFDHPRCRQLIPTRQKRSRPPPAHTATSAPGRAGQDVPGLFRRRFPAATRALKPRCSAAPGPLHDVEKVSGQGQGAGEGRRDGVEDVEGAVVGLVDEVVL
jgi:hypothetical protein